MLLPPQWATSDYIYTRKEARILMVEVHHEEPVSSASISACKRKTSSVETGGAGIRLCGSLVVSAIAK